MRSWKLLACSLVVVVACGESTESTTTTTADSVAATSSTTVPSTAATSTTTTSPPTTTGAPGEWSAAEYGTNPAVALGSSGALGSGCAPGTDSLPDGVWFGWIDEAGSSGLEFDLACLWPGRLEAAVSNDSIRLRTVAVAQGALVHIGDDPVAYADWAGDPTTMNNAPGLPRTPPFWLFVNEGHVTELAQYPEPVVWALSRSAWPEQLAPGCCATGVIAPPSPAASLPDTGWPADGFYGAYLVDPRSRLSPDGGYEVEISKLISCSHRPDLCLPDWNADNVSSDPDAPTIERLIPFDSGTTVVLMPIFSDAALVSDGEAFAGLIDDISNALAPIGDPTENWDELTKVASAHRDDPDYPLGIADTPDSTEDWPIGYRGPGGTYVTVHPPWMALEIRDGSPILYIHVGMVAG